MVFLHPDLKLNGIPLGEDSVLFRITSPVSLFKENRGIAPGLYT
jgi:hypothetical protein